MLLRNRFRSFENKLQKVPAGKLIVYGELEGAEREFGAEELGRIEPAQQVLDVESFKSGFHGRAVRLAGILQLCQPKSGPLYFNAASRDGKRVLAFWLKEVEPLAWVVYETGSFQLLVPGSVGVRESVADLALIEISSHAAHERFG